MLLEYHHVTLYEPFMWKMRWKRWCGSILTVVLEARRCLAPRKRKENKFSSIWFSKVNFPQSFLSLSFSSSSKQGIRETNTLMASRNEVPQCPSGCRHIITWSRIKRVEYDVASSGPMVPPYHNFRHSFLIPVSNLHTTHTHTHTIRSSSSSS